MNYTAAVGRAHVTQDRLGSATGWHLHETSVG